jgi:hypothetical protein
VVPDVTDYSTFCRRWRPSGPYRAGRLQRWCVDRDGGHFLRRTVAVILAAGIFEVTEHELRSETRRPGGCTVPEAIYLHDTVHERSAACFLVGDDEAGLIERGQKSARARPVLWPP